MNDQTPGPFKTHTAAEMSALAQSLWKAQQKLKLAKLKLKPQEDVCNALEAELQHALLANKLESVASRNATCSLKRTEFAELKDDLKFFAFASKRKNWDLLRKQVNVGAARERWNDNKIVPGVERGVRVDLSVTTRSKA